MLPSPQNTTKQDCIRALISAGFTLIPLNGKIPLDKNWPATIQGAYNEKNIGNKNYGIRLSKEHLIIDIDPRNFPEGTNPFKKLSEIIGPISTFIVKTGGGGYHIYFLKPPGMEIRGGLPEFPGIEFKSKGRQVVGPGSVHPDTKKEYVVHAGDPSHIAQVPQALLDLIKAVPMLLNSGTGGFKDDEATQERFARYLKVAPISVEGQHGDDRTFKIACAGRDQGLPSGTVYSLLEDHYNPRCVPPWGPDDLRSKVAHAYRYARGEVGSKHPEAHFEKIDSGFHHVEGGSDDGIAEDIEGKPGWKLDGKKQVIKCFQNLLKYFALPEIKLKGVFGFNDFTRRVEFIAPAPWHHTAQMNGSSPRTGNEISVQDVDLSRLRAYLARHHGFDTTATDLVDAMVDVAQARRFHPVKRYLSALKWDGVPRLDTWLIDYLGVEDDSPGYARAVGRKTLCAAVARVFKPGIKFDHVLLLEGTQNIGKSGVCKILGGDWFADFKMNAGEKDTVQMMQGKWIVEIAELHATRQTDMDTLKAFLTRQVDEARFAYGRLPGQYPRQGIFIATYNPGPDGTYLKDDTGNRRWWPVRCAGVPPGSRHFDFAGLTKVRDQIFAEAVSKWKGGESLTMETEKLQDAATRQQAERHAEHPWKERISLWLEERDRVPETKVEFLTAREVYIMAMNGLDARFDRRSELSIAKAMRDLGWQPGFDKENGKTRRGYRLGIESVTPSLPTTTEKKKEGLDNIFGDLL